MTDNPTVCPPTTKGTRHLNQGNAPGRLSPYSQLVECQRLLMEEMRNSAGKPMARAVVARAINEIEGRKREMRMMPKPKPVDVIENANRRSRKLSSARPIDRDPSVIVDAATD